MTFVRNGGSHEYGCKPMTQLVPVNRPLETGDRLRHSSWNLAIDTSDYTFLENKPGNIGVFVSTYGRSSFNLTQFEPGNGWMFVIEGKKEKKLTGFAAFMKRTEK